jgi:hypothetical protein
MEESWLNSRRSKRFLSSLRPDRLGSHPALYTMGSASVSPGCGGGGGGPEIEADHPPPASAELKNGGAILPLPQIYSWHGAQLSTGTSLPLN